MCDPHSVQKDGGLVLVTGANGFIGSHLVEGLLASGYQVRCLVRKSSDLTHLRNLPVQVAYASLENPHDLEQACRGLDWVCHCAGLTRALNENEFLQVNTRGTEALARACLEVNPGLRRFLFLSSQAAAGPSGGIGDFLDESSPPRPITWYGRSKLLAEQALLDIDGQFPVTIVRPCAVLGPRDRDFYAYFRLVQLGVNLQVGSEDRWVSVIHVYDLVRLLLVALDSPSAVGQTYFGCGPAIRRSDLSAAIAKALNKRAYRVTVPDSALTVLALGSRWQERLTRKPVLVNCQRILDLRQQYWLCSEAKAQRELGFTPLYDLDTAVQQTTAWYLEHGWL